ncbi:PqqD family peptide modification chaperone [Anderseniella sp. Alg231-50]|uniref:PqqD family peptide modification chaperone n=1 Tax=Anderseniella sp. Alg231-50 TaxID=1922226 RepID=UPI000D55A60E
MHDLKVTVSTSILVQEVEDETVILNLKNENYYRLDGTAARIWQLLGKLGSRDKVTEAMASEYQVPVADLQRDVEALIAEFVQLDLLHTAEESPSPSGQD